MKLTILFVLIGLLSAQAKSISQTVTFSGKKVPLARVFNVVEKQTGYAVFANKNLLSDAKPVSLSVSNMPLRDFLDLAFRDQRIGYEISNKTIFIKEKVVGSNSVAGTKEINQPEEEDPPIEIKGVVRGSDGAPLEGATVIVKGTSNSTITDASGGFTISGEPDQVLVVSYVGFRTIEERIGNRTIINIVMERVVSEVEQVVVAALGISKRVRALTYNVQEIKGDEISPTNRDNFVNSLAGKVAGATINSSSAGAGGSSRVILRGSKSIYGNNNVLYVIDGIPMPNSTNNASGQAADIFSGAGQTGDFVSNINPEDIASISILSGPSAAALYGSAAANGVIVITTKKGQQGRLDISLNNTTTFSSPLLLPKFQNTYGVSDIGSYYSWGEKLETPSTYDPADFFQTGINSTTGITLSTGTEKNQTYLSLGNVSSRGIIHNNNFDRSNFTVRNSTVLADGKVNLDIGFMGGLVHEQNMISQGQYFNPLVAVYLFPPGDDFHRVKAFERYDASRNLKTQFWPYGDNGLLMQNPYWVIERDLFKNKKERSIANLSLKYNVADWINLLGRVKMDKSDEKAEKKFAASTNTLFASETGYYSLTTFNTRQIYADALANINKSLNEDYKLTANIGTSIQDVVYDRYMYGGKLQGVANLYTYENVNRSTSETSQSGFHTQKQSVFGSAQLGYQNKIYFDAAARNDWASPLAGANKNSFFYSSAGLSTIVTDLLPVKSSTLSYLKLRASYAEVGNEPEPFLTNPTYPLAGGFPATQTRLPNPDLEPELTKSWELGLNASLFKGAFSIAATVYSSRTYNQFFVLPLSAASGYTNVVVNGGRVDNKGIEASIKYSRKFGSLSWNSYATYSLNSNKIVELLPEWINPVTKEQLSLTERDLTGTGSYKMRLVQGGAMGAIYVNTLRTDEHGAIYVDPGSQSVVGESNKFVYAGNSNPKYNLGWGNELKWKGIGLSFLFTARVGGIVVSNTQAIMDAFGVSKASADARDAGGAIVNGRPIPSQPYYQVVGAGASGGIASMYCYSATNARLAELSLGYEIPVNKWWHFVKGANVSFVGRNLFLLYNRAPFDPELTANTQTYFQGIDYFMMPSLRSLGFSVKLDF